MTSFAPILRFHVYADETTNAILQAPVTAPHQDFFRVASRTGISGFQPYLFAEPDIDAQSISLPEIQSTVGSCKIQLADFRVGSGQFARWVTAFTGRTNAENLLLGKRCLLDVSYDNGVSYQPLYAGRVARAELVDIVMTLEIRDSGVDLKETVFTGLDPSLSYAAQEALCPRGLTRTLGDPASPVYLKGLTPLRGRLIRTRDPNTFYNIENPGVNIGLVEATSLFYIKLDGPEHSRPDNVVTDAFRQAVSSLTYSITLGSGNQGVGTIFSNAFVFLRNVTRNESGFMTCVKINTRNIGGEDRLLEFDARVLPFEFIGRVNNPLGWAPNDVIECYFVQPSQPTETARYWVTPPSIGQFLGDIVAGRFNWNVVSGSIPRFAKTGSTFTSPPPSNLSFPLRFAISKAETLETVVTEYIGKPFGIAYRQDIETGSFGTGSVLNLFSTRRPDTLPPVVLDESDIVTSTDVQWLSDPPFSSIQITQYRDFDDARTRNITSQPDTFLTFLTAGASLQGQSLAIDGNGIRYNTSTRDGSAIQDESNRNVTARYITTLQSDLVEQYGRGRITVRMTVRRSAKTVALRLGDWVLVDTVRIPNPSTQQRGGQRLMQITSISPKLAEFELELLDAGLTTAVAAPTTPTVTIPAGATGSLVIGWNSGTRVQVQVGVHPEGVGSLPANSPLWNTTTTTTSATVQSVLVSGLPASRTVSVRIRGISDQNGILQLPSPWVSVGTITIPALPQLTSVAFNTIRPSSVNVTWTNPNTDYPVEVLVRSPDNPLTPFTQSIALLDPTSNRYTIRGFDGFDPSSIGVGVRLIDTAGSTGPIASGSFATSGINQQLPSIPRVVVYRG